MSPGGNLASGDGNALARLTDSARTDGADGWHRLEFEDRSEDRVGNRLRWSGR
jgi:hypothetical protein